MLGWRVKVTKTDGVASTHAVLPTTIVAFERNFKTGLAAAFTNDQKMEHLFWLGWDAERRAGNVVKPFDEWLDTIALVEVETESSPLGETA
jgi:hypothetical protein